MSAMADLDLQLQEIHEIMQPTEGERAQIFIERTVSSIINDLDQLCAFAADSSTIDFIEAEKVAIGQIVTRAQLVASLLMTRQYAKFKATKAVN